MKGRRIKSSPHGPYKLGYTHATMAITKRNESESWSKSSKNRLSSDC